jgi:hypothetical protein
MEPRNRDERRHPEQVREETARQPADSPQSSQHELAEAANPDVQSVRAKSTGHGKKTADKWNQ